MILLPAIDIIGGQCVRLNQGDYNKKSVYFVDPLEMARQFQDDGATMVHVVDLDGAKIGAPSNRELILKMADNLSIPIQVGGGIRTVEDVSSYLENGVERILLGTVALENPEIVRELIKQYGQNRIVVAVEIKQNKLAVRGWLKTSEISVEDYLASLKKIGVKIILVTDIQKDGMLSGPNLELIKNVVNENFEVLSAGGVASLGDLTDLNEVGASGVVIGKALYEGQISFKGVVNNFIGKNNLTKRIIPCLDVAGGRVVKGINFKNLKDVGDPVEIAKFYSGAGADELVFLDITATKENRDTIYDLAKRAAANINIPFTIGGGIKNIGMIKKLLDVGADKVSINSAAVLDPDFVSEAVKIFGSQCIVISIDARKNGKNWEMCIKGGSETTGIDAVDFARQMQACGVGELLVNSLDKDGTKDGYDVELLKAITKSVSIPVIASSGAGRKEDFLEVFQKTRVDAVLAASLFHSGEIKINELKEYLKSNGENIRL